MKILEVTAFSAGFCGLWTRVSKESELLAKKGHDVYVFSSNIKRGLGKIETAAKFEVVNGVKVHRFKTFGKFGDNTFFWHYMKEALKLKPEIIITHAYRQYYATQALIIAKKLNIPCILVTHAPFLEKKLRSGKLNIVVEIYDSLIGKNILNKYSKIFTITKWEIPYLLEIGARREKLFYIPNGVPEEFFKIKKTNQKKQNGKKQLLFLGRVAPIKDFETLLHAFKICIGNGHDFVLNVIGPVEENYGVKIKKLLNRLKLNSYVNFPGPVYDLQEKIQLIDECDAFILPSKREGMPQALVEAMSRGKIVISSDTDGGKEIVSDNKNAFLFKIGNTKQLSERICSSLNNDKNLETIRKNAKTSVEQYSWAKIIEKIEREISNLN